MQKIIWPNLQVYCFLSLLSTVKSSNQGHIVNAKPSLKEQNNNIKKDSFKRPNPDSYLSVDAFL